jgi:hypothetical protein
MDESKLGFLSTSDIYDFYGLTMVDADSIDEDSAKLYNFYLRDIKSKYIESLAHRIRLEAKWMGLDLDGNSITALVGKLSAKIDEEINKQAAKMRMTGTGFNMLDFVKSQQGQKQRDLDIAADTFRSKEGKSRPAYGGEPWAKISEAFLKVEKADTPKDIIQAVDALNSLQHNCCHVLFDLTNTRYGGEPDDATAVRAVLEEKFKAKTPKEFEKKMSQDVRKFLKGVGAL